MKIMPSAPRGTPKAAPQLFRGKIRSTLIGKFHTRKIPRRCMTKVAIVSRRFSGQQKVHPSRKCLSRVPPLRPQSILLISCPQKKILANFIQFSFPLLFNHTDCVRASMEKSFHFRKVLYIHSIILRQRCHFSSCC